MAANVDSPKRRSLRLQRGSNEEVTSDPRSLKAPPSGGRTSGPRTRLSGDYSSVTRPRRRSNGQIAEEPGHSRKVGRKAELQPPRGAQHPTEDGARRTPNKKSVKASGSREGPQDDRKRGRPENDCRIAPSLVNQERNDIASSQKSKERSQEDLQKSEALAREVQASSTTSRTEDGEIAGPSVDRTRTDVEEAGPSGVCRAPRSETAGPSRQSASQDHEDVNPPLLSTSRRLVGGTKSPVRNADQGRSDAASCSAPLRDSKVQCSSKQLLQGILGMCAEFSKEILENQRYLNEKQRQQEQRNFIWNFETAFQDNVSINGQTWQEAPDIASEPDLKILEDELDDAIVETAMKRKRHPRKILGHFVKELKAERLILDQYKPVVQPMELKLDSRTESRMTSQTATMASISQQIKETMKALPAQLEKAEGFSQVLNLQPMLQGSRIRQDIFSSQVVVQDIAKTVPKQLVTLPGENEPTANIASVLNMRRRQAPSVHNDLYPLKSKRKTHLEG